MGAYLMVFATKFTKMVNAHVPQMKYAYICKLFAYYLTIMFEGNSNLEGGT